MQNIRGGWSGAGAAAGGHGTLGGGFLGRMPVEPTRRPGPKFSAVDHLIERIAPCPWSATAGSNAPQHATTRLARRPLYTPEQRLRRDTTSWTMVQGVLAPVQFAVFLVSLGLVLSYLATGSGYEVATASVVAKTVILYAIMVTGSIWEKKVFDKYLFAQAFFWEDVVSMLVLTLHTVYLVELLTGTGSERALMLLALAAYASYAINATQFILKLRAARLEGASARPAGATAGKAK